MEPTLTPSPKDPTLTEADQKSALMVKLNNLTNACVEIFGQAGSKLDAGKMFRSVIREAIEVGAQYQRDLTQAGGTISRPSADTKAKAEAKPKTKAEAEAEAKQKAEAATAAL